MTDLERWAYDIVDGIGDCSNKKEALAFAEWMLQGLIDEVKRQERKRP